MDCSRPDRLVVVRHRETVVAEMPLSDGTTRPAIIRTFNHYYHGSRRDRHGRGNLGYTAHRVEEVDGPRTVSFYDNHTYREDGHIYPLRGRLVRQVTELNLADGEGGTAVHRVETSISYKTVATDSSHFSYPERRDVWVYNDAGIVTRSLVSIDTVDEFGNITKRRRSFGYSGDDVKTTLSTYRNDTESWLIGKLASRTTTSTVLSSSKTRTMTYSYAPYGALQTITREPDDPDHKLTTTFETDAFGNLSHLVQTDASGESRETSITYDDEEKIEVISI